MEKQKKKIIVKPTKSIFGIMLISIIPVSYLLSQFPIKNILFFRIILTFITTNPLMLLIIGSLFVALDFIDNKLARKAIITFEEGEDVNNEKY